MVAQDGGGDDYVLRGLMRASTSPMPFEAQCRHVWSSRSFGSRSCIPHFKGLAKAGSGQLTEITLTVSAFYKRTRRFFEP
jgi:hypothetical protein